METLTPKHRCAVCGTLDTKQNPLIHECGDKYLCLNDYNSKKGNRWRERRRRDDPAYDRYRRLVSLGGPRQGPVCGLGMQLRPKARGMGAGTWEVCCVSCHRVSISGLSVARAEQAQGYQAVEALEGDYLRGRINDEGLEEAIHRLAGEDDGVILPARCECGGHYSVAAKPRCARCASVLLDTYFYYAWRPDTGPVEQRAAPDAREGD